MCRWLWVLCCGVFLFAESGYAADVERISIEGRFSGVEKWLLRLPHFSIDRQQLDQKSSRDVLEVLRAVPGLDVTQQGGLGGLSFVSIRGGDPNHVLVLVDGVAVNNSTNSRGGAFDFNAMDLDLIERIDVFYGGSAFLHGSEALAGVISITTRQNGDEKSLQLTLVKDEFGGEKASLSGGFHTDSSRWLGSFSEARGDSGPFGNEFQRRIASVRAMKPFSEHTLGDVNLHHSEYNGAYFPEDSGGPQFAVIRVPERRAHKEDFIQTRISHEVNETLEWDFNLSAFESRDISDSPGIAEGLLQGIPPVMTDALIQRQQALLQMRGRSGDSFIWGSGLTMQHEKGTMDSVIDFGFPLPAQFLLTQKQQGLFLDATWEPNAKTLFDIGLRQEWLDNHDIVTGRLRSIVQLTPNQSLSVQFANGEKSPSLFALGHPLVGNPFLQPEASRTLNLEWKVSWQELPVSHSVSVFENSFFNLVDFDAESFTHINRGEINVSGIEASVYFKLAEHWRLNANASVSDYQLDASGVPLRRRPEQKAVLGVTYQAHDTLSLALDVRFTGDFYDSSIPTGMVKLNGFNTIDLGIHWRASDRSQLSVLANNLSDETYFSSVGFEGLGRALQVRWVFRL